MNEIKGFSLRRGIKTFVYKNPFEKYIGQST